MSNVLAILPPPAPMTTTDQTVAAESVLDDGKFGHFNLVDIRISRTNRKRFSETKLNELANSIKAKGVAQPILIRPVTPTAEEPQSFEIVAGERRFRASIIAGRISIPAMCRDLSDLDALELQILENLQRDDPHALEEAEGYERLMLTHGYNADQLAEKLSKSRSYIYGRLKLCALSLDVREQFLEDKFSPAIALLVARLPLAKLQTKAMNEILRPNGWPNDEPMSYRKAKEWLQQNYMLDLRKAIFMVDDAKLVKAAGNCNKCPKRAGNQPEVFEGVPTNLCTDPDCFKEKTAAHHDKLFTLASAQGIPVREGAEASEIWSAIYRAGSEYVSEDTPLYTFVRVAPHTGMAGTVGSCLKAAQRPPVVAYTRGHDGVMESLYARTSTQAVLEQAGICETEEARAAGATGMKDLQQETPDAAEVETELTVEGRTKDLTDKRVSLYKAMRAAAKGGLNLTMMREATKLLLRSTPLPDDLIGDLYPFKDRSDAGVCAYIDHAEFEQVELLMLDLIVGEYLSAPMWEMKGSDDSFGKAAIHVMARSQGIAPEDESPELAAAPNTAPELPGANELDAVQRGTIRLKPKAAEAPADTGLPIVKIKKQRLLMQPGVWTEGKHNV